MSHSRKLIHENVIGLVEHNFVETHDHKIPALKKTRTSYGTTSEKTACGILTCTGNDARGQGKRSEMVARCTGRRIPVTAIPLSVCIITYNEEDNIQGALETVQMG